MLTNNEGNFYAYIKEQMQIKGADNTSSKRNDKLSAIENRLLEMVDSLKIAKYKPKDDDNF